MNKECYCGSIKETNKLMKTSSGGAATALAEEFINNGGVVIGVKWSSDFKTCLFKLAKSMSDLEEISGTKYVFPRYKIEVDNLVHDLLVSKTFIESNKYVSKYYFWCSEI